MCSWVQGEGVDSGLGGSTTTPLAPRSPDTLLARFAAPRLEDSRVVPSLPNSPAVAEALPSLDCDASTPLESPVTRFVAPNPADEELQAPLGWRATRRRKRREQRWGLGLLDRWASEKPQARYTAPAEAWVGPPPLDGTAQESDSDTMRGRQVTPMKHSVDTSADGTRRRTSSSSTGNLHRLSSTRTTSDSRRKRQSAPDSATAKQLAAATRVTRILLDGASHKEPSSPHPFSASRASQSALSSKDSFKIVTNAVVREVDEDYDFSFPDMVVRGRRQHCVHALC